MRSFAHCSSSARSVAFLGRGEAALRREAELVESGRELRGLLDPGVRIISLLFQLPRLRGHDEQTTFLALRGSAGLESAGAVGIPFHDEPVHRHAVEQPLATGSYRRPSDEGRAEVAAAQVHEIVRAAGLSLSASRTISGIDLRAGAPGSFAASRSISRCLGIAEIRKRDVVELEVGQPAV
jgi:hypothetical protein